MLPGSRGNLMKAIFLLCPDEDILAIFVFPSPIT